MKINNIDLLSKLNLLMIDDDKESLDSLEYILKNFFKSTYKYDNPLEAYNFLSNHLDEVDVIITDLRMPNLDGVDLCKKLRKENINIPIIILSSHSNSKDLLELVSLGLVDYIVKPLTSNKLEKVLSTLTNKLSGHSIYKIDENLSYDYSKKQLFQGNNLIDLSEKEIILLELLIKNIDKLVTKDEIQYALYVNEIMTDNAYRNILWRLRKKVPSLNIKTLKNMGVSLEKISNENKK